MSLFDGAKSIVFANKNVTKLELDGVVLWQAVTYKNWVKYSTESDGVTIYNGGLGYKDGYRVRSGGAEVGAGDAFCTGFIPVKGGDAIYLSGWNFSHASAANAINVSDSNRNNIGQFTMQPASYGILNAYDGAYKEYSFSSVVEVGTGVWKWVVPPSDSGVAYIRITGYQVDKTGADMIVTINEEIPT